MTRSLAAVFAASLLATVSLAAPPRPAPEVEGRISIPDGAVAWPEDLTRSLRVEDDFVRMSGVDLGGGLRADLELHRAAAFGDAFRIEAARFVRSGRGGRIERRDLAAPDLVIRRGVAKDADGGVLGEAWFAAGRKVLGGFVRLEDGTRFIASAPHGERRPPLAFDPASVAANLLPTGGPFCEAIEPPAPEGGSSFAGGVAGAVTQCFELAIAIETDLEFTNALFGGDLEAASEYASP